jgi:hypothetical protein
MPSIAACMRRWRPNCAPRKGTSWPPCWPRAKGALLSHATAAWRWRIVPAPPSLVTLAVARRRKVEGLKLRIGGADCDDDRDLWLRRHGYVARRYGKRQIEQRPDEVIADLLDAFAEAVTLGYAGRAAA